MTELLRASRLPRDPVPLPAGLADSGLASWAVGWRHCGAGRAVSSGEHMVQVVAVGLASACKGRPAVLTPVTEAAWEKWWIWCPIV